MQIKRIATFPTRPEYNDFQVITTYVHTQLMLAAVAEPSDLFEQVMHWAGLYQKLIIACNDIKPNYSRFHPLGVQKTAVGMIKAAGGSLALQLDASVAGQIHDIGKIKIPDSILYKQGRLTRAEERMMRLHAIYGYAMALKIPGLEQLSLIALAHHDRTCLQAIPNVTPETRLLNEIITIADAFDAMTNERIYHSPERPVKTKLEAAEEIARCVGEQFDAHAYEVFFKPWVAQNFKEETEYDLLELQYEDKIEQIVTQYPDKAAMLLEKMLKNIVELLQTIMLPADKSDLRGENHVPQTRLALKIAQEKGLSVQEQEELKLELYFLVLGQMFIPDIQQVPKTNEEKKQNRRLVVEKAAEILGWLPFVTQKMLLDIRYSSESYAGNDGVFGLHGEDIPIAARIMRLVNSYTNADKNIALLESEQYRPCFDPQLMELLKKIVQ